MDIEKIDPEIKHFKSVLTGKFGGRMPQYQDFIELQQYFLEELSGTWEWTYKRYIDNQKGDRSNFKEYSRQNALVVDRVELWYKIIYNLRIKYKETILNNPSYLKQEKKKCREDPSHFINFWCWIQEPRMASYRNSKGQSLPTMLPFIMYQGQQRVVEEIEFCMNNSLDYIIAKSREAGISWGAMALVLQKWLFEPGFRAGIGSEKKDKVDIKGSTNPLFGKIRFMLYNLPNEFRPTAYRHNKNKNLTGENNPYDKILNLQNPDNKAEILGETGESIGEGGRYTTFIIDEEQNLSNPDNVNRSLESTTNCRGGIGTSRGMNHFGRKWASDTIHHISVMWFEDPRKVGTAALKLGEDGKYQGKIPLESYWHLFKVAETKDNPEIMAQSYYMDWQAAVTDLCIEPRWIQAAIDFELPSGGNDDEVAGFDVAGGGSNSSVYQARKGNVLQWPKEIRMGEVTQNMMQAHQYATDDKVHALHYDKQAIGESMFGLLMALNEEINYTLVGIAGNDGASNKILEGEGVAANQIYKNQRSEIWHKMRSLFRNTFNHVNGIRVHSADEMISIPNHPKLIEQLAYPKRFSRNGRWIIESKQEMRSRGLKSPDFADAAAYCIGDVDAASRGILGSFTRSAQNGQFTQIDVRPDQQGWEYICGIYHNSYNDVSALLSRWHPRTRKLQIVQEFQAEGPQPQQIKAAFTSLLSEMNSSEIKWITQKKMFEDMKQKNEYQLNSLYRKANIRLNYNYGEDVRSALLLTNQMFEQKIITIGFSCRELVAQISGLEMKPNSIDEKYGLPNALLLVVQYIKEKRKNSLAKALNSTPVVQGYGVR